MKTFPTKYGAVELHSDVCTDPDHPPSYSVHWQGQYCGVIESDYEGVWHSARLDLHYETFPNKLTAAERSIEMFQQQQATLKAEHPLLVLS